MLISKEEKQEQYKFNPLPYYKSTKGIRQAFVSKNVTKDARDVFYILADHLEINSAHSSMPLSEIVHFSGMSTRKTLNCLSELEGKGFLKIDRSNGQKGNVYQLKWVFSGLVENKAVFQSSHDEEVRPVPKQSRSGSTSCARNIFPVINKRENNNTDSTSSNASKSLLSFSLDSLKLQHKSAFKQVSKEDLKQMMNQFGFEPLQVHITQLEKRYRDTSTYDPNRKVCENAGGLLRTSLTRQFEYQDKVEQQETKKKETTKMSQKVYEQTRQEVETQNKELDSDLEKARKVDGLKEKATGIVKITFPTMREDTMFFSSAVDAEIVNLFKAEGVLV